MTKDDLHVRVHANSIDVWYPDEWWYIDCLREIVAKNGYTMGTLMFVMIKNFITDFQAGKIQVRRGEIYQKLEIVRQD